MERLLPFRRKAFIKTTAVLLSTFLLTACSAFQSPVQNTAVRVAKSTEAATAEVRKGDISLSVTGIGSFQPAKSISLFYKDVSGPVKKIHTQMGDEVKAGQTLAEIDIQELFKRIEEKELVMQRWKIKNAQNEENLFITARSLKQAELELEKTQKIYKLENTYLNEVAYEKARLQYEQAVSASKNAKWNKEASEIEYKIDERDLAVQRAKIAEAKLNSPVDGITVFVERLSETEMVSAGRVIFRIAEPKQMVFQILTGDARYMQGIKDATLTVGNERYGVTTYVPQPGDQLEQTSSDMKAKNKLYVAFTNKMPKIILNEPIAVKLEVRKSNTLLIPRSAMREENGKSMVDVLNGSSYDTMEIIRGLEKDDLVEVIGGIAEGTKVILR